MFADEVDKTNNEIRAYVQDALNRFSRATGITPSTIWIELASVQSLGEPQEHHIVSRVRMRFDV